MQEIIEILFAFVLFPSKRNPKLKIALDKYDNYIKNFL